MVIISFVATDPGGEWYESAFGAISLEECLETVNCLVREDWKIQQVNLFNGSSRYIPLPVESFDGESVLEALSQLEQEWKACLK